MVENFKRIKGYEDGYLISDFGRVVKVFKNGKQQEIKQHRQHNGYLVVHLWKNNNRKKLRVNRLVAKHYLYNDDPDFKVDVHHLDNDISNNFYLNLEWCDHITNLHWRSKGMFNREGKHEKVS